MNKVYKKASKKTEDLNRLAMNLNTSRDRKEENMEELHPYFWDELMLSDPVNINQKRIMKLDEEYFSFNQFGAVEKIDILDLEEIYTERSISDKLLNPAHKKMFIDQENKINRSFESRETVKDNKSKLSSSPPKKEKSYTLIDSFANIQNK